MAVKSRSTVMKSSPISVTLTIESAISTYASKSLKMDNSFASVSSAASVLSALGMFKPGPSKIISIERLPTLDGIYNAT